MRKVLLATTALVALGGVSVANADITIGGGIEWEYRSTDAADTSYNDGNLEVKATTTSDAGVEYAVVHNVGIHTGAVEQVYISVSSADIGTLYLGNIDDDAPGLLDGALGANNDIESELWSAGDATDDTHAWRTPIAGGGSQVTWISPSLAGLKVGVSVDSANDQTAMAATYSIGGTSVYFGTNEDRQNMGVKTSLAGFTLAAGSRREDGTTRKASDVALKYTLDNGITVAGLSARGTTSTGAKMNYSNFGASYAVAPGVTAKVEAGDSNNVNYTWMSLAVSF